MQPIVFKLKLFRGPGDFERSKETLLWLLEALCRANQGHLEQFPYPPLYQSGVRYQRENGTEEWLDIPTIIEAGWGDCEDLACWRVAELRMKGVHASPYVKFRRTDGVYHFHALVGVYAEVPDSELEVSDSGITMPEFRLVKIEDPSLRLGMGWEAEYARRRGVKPAAESSGTPAAVAEATGAAGAQPDSFCKEPAGGGP
jgi:hypothetical protein